MRLQLFAKFSCLLSDTQYFRHSCRHFIEFLIQFCVLLIHCDALLHNLRHHPHMNTGLDLRHIACVLAVHAHHCMDISARDQTFFSSERNLFSRSHFRVQNNVGLYITARADRRILYKFCENISARNDCTLAGSLHTALETHCTAR